MLGDVADSNSEAGLLIGPVLYQELSHMFCSLAFALINLIFFSRPHPCGIRNPFSSRIRISTGLQYDAFCRNPF